jgi:RND family efflux transporter MFP subunit
MTAQKVIQTDLALRKPQLAQALADVAAAEADLTQAELNLARTRVTAPFNAMIVERAVNIGAYAGSQDSLVSLVGTNEFWIQALIPLDQLSYMDLGDPGSCPVKIQSQAGVGTWEGRVIQVTGKLSDSSRMAQVIVAVKNPLGTRIQPSAHPLMIDDYVNVTITGRILDHVVALPRAAFKDGDTVWVNSDNTLQISKVTLAWKDTENVYIRNGITQGDEVVISDLSAPVPGMALKSSAVKASDVSDAGNAAGGTIVEERDPS